MENKVNATIKYIIDKCKFEYLFAFVILIMLGSALWIFKENTDIVNIIVTVLVGAISSITTFFFTKHIPDKKE